jgi:hypothetical protein
MAVKNKTTKLYSFRLEVELMDKIRQKADEEGYTATQLVSKYLKAGVGEVSEKSNSAHTNRTAILKALFRLLSDNSDSEPDELLLRLLSGNESTRTDELEALNQRFEVFGQLMNDLGKQVEQLTTKFSSISPHG